MNIASTIWAIVAPLLLALAVALIAAWGNAMVYAAQMIYQAYLNAELVTGAEKMAWVVAQVKAYLPGAISAVVKDNRVQSACQSIYDAIKMYAVTYLDKSKNEDGAENEQK